MSSKTYYGWSNYETWNFSVWIGNEEGSHRYWKEKAQEVYDESESTVYNTREEEAAIKLADRLKDEFLEANPLADDCSMWTDLMNAALSEVNWYEIASGMIAEADKEEEEDDNEDE